MMMSLFRDGILILGFLVRFVLLFRRATPYISTVPKNAIALFGEKVILECTTDLSTPVRWTLQSPDAVNAEFIYYNEVITEDFRSKFQIETTAGGTYNLIIERIDLSHAGIYRCLPTIYPGEKEDCFSAQVTVLASEPICDTNTSSFSTDGVEGDVIKLTCSIMFAGCWRPVMNWYKSNGENVDGSVLLNDTNLLVTTSLIINLNSSDNDIIYSCQIYFSPNSTKSCPQREEDIRETNIPYYQHIWNYTTNVLYEPRNIRIYPTQAEYEIGDCLRCSAYGNPSPAYEWTENGNGRRDVVHGPVLTVDETMVSGHELILRCTATNVVARKRKDVSATVKVIVTGNRVDQTYILGIALPITCSIVPFALAVCLIIRCRNEATNRAQEIVTRHEYETVSETHFQNQGTQVVTNESHERQDTRTDGGYMELTGTQPVIYSQLHT